MDKTVLCPSCNEGLEIPEEHFGSKVECPYCQGKFVVETEIMQEPSPDESENLQNKKVTSTKRTRSKSADFSPEMKAASVKRSHLPTKSAKKQNKSSKRSVLTLLMLFIFMGGGGVFAYLLYSGGLQNSGADVSKGETSPFKTIGTISGIEVITEINPPIIKVDATLQVLLNSGSVAFKKALEKKLMAEGIDKDTTNVMLRKAANKKDVVLNLARFQILNAVGTAGLDTVLARREGKAFISRLFSSQDWLNDFLIAGPLSSKQAQSINQLHGLCTIFRYDKECTVPLYRKLACAYARNRSRDWTQDFSHFDLVDVYQGHKRVHKRGRMHRSFNDMESWEMLWITCTPRMGDARALRYMTDIVHYRWNKYWGACWSISYRGTNQFGTSIHSRDYYYPWQNEFTGEVLKHRMGGGVCGTLSNFGSGLARAHGVPSFPVGQPGHCAYMLRPGTSYWGTAYSVTGDTRAGTFFDSGDETIVRLTQDAFKKETRSKLLTSSIYDWMAIFLEKQYPTFTDAERTARELSLKAHPIHYNHWKRYAKRLASAEPKTTSKEWASFSHRFVKALGHYQRPCLNFLTAYIVPNLKSFTPKECMDMATDWHQMLPKKGEGIHQCSSRHFPRYLASHANKFKNDPVLAATFFRMLLGEYAGSQHFSNVLSWGKANLTNKKESTAKFINTLSSFSKNNKQASQGFSHILGQIIIDAEKNGDVDTFNSTSWLGDSLFSGADKASEKEFSHIYHTSKKTLDTRAPKQTKKFKGKLLSANALPFIEFPHSPKTGLSHRAALQPDRLGFLITQKKKRPRIDIKLPGRCKLSGITIVSRFETSTARSFPMKVSASIDGKKWKHLVTFKDPKAMHEADLSTKLPEALWVRFERDNDKVDYFELRAVRIYGKQLY